MSGRNHSKNQKRPSLKDHISDSEDEEIDEDMAFNSDDERLYGHMFDSSRNRKKNQTSSSKFKNIAMDDNSDHSSVDNDEEALDDDDDFFNSENESDDDSNNDDDDDDNNDEEDDGGQYMMQLLEQLDDVKPSSSDKLQLMSAEQVEATLHRAKNIKESEFDSAVLKSDELTMDQLLTSIAGTQGYQHLKNTFKGLLPTFASSSSSKNTATHTQKQSAASTSSFMIAPTPTPVSRVVAERASRKVHYQQQVKDVSSWIETVKQHREAETLDFRPINRIHITKDELIGKFEPTTDFEKEIANALELANAKQEADILRREQDWILKGTHAAGSDGGGGGDAPFHTMDDDLGYGSLSMEELKKRQGQMAKLRALLFYEEHKRHHMNKIKSKKYRKIRKRIKLKNQEEEEKLAAEVDVDYARQLEEREEMERVKERMSLAHKNTSKWAKRILQRGKHADKETRRALSEQLRIGDTLRHKMMTTRGHDINDYDHDDDDDDDDDDKNIKRKAEDLYTGIQKDATSNSVDTENKLLNLAFMKKGVALQRERALAEARQLLLELEADEIDAEESDTDDVASPKHIKTKHVPFSDDAYFSTRTSKTATKKELEAIMESGKFVAKGLSVDRGISLSMTGNIELQGQYMDSQLSKNLSKKKTEPGRDFDFKVSNLDKNPIHLLSDDEKRTFHESFQHTPHDTCKIDQNLSKKSQNESPSELSDNPWILSIMERKKEVEGNQISKEDTVNVKTTKTANKSKKARTVNIQKAVERMISSDDPVVEVQNSSSAVDVKVATKASSIIAMSQSELVRLAFVAPSQVEIEDEFEKEKVMTKEQRQALESSTLGDF